MPSGFALPDKPDSGTQPQTMEHVTPNVNDIGLTPTAQNAVTRLLLRRLHAQQFFFLFLDDD